MATSTFRQTMDQAGYPTYGNYAWYRFKLRIPAAAGPQAILLMSIYTGYQVYADGRLIGSKGSFEPSRAPVFAYKAQSYRLPATSLGDTGPGTMQIAIRVWEYPLIPAFAGAGPLSGGSEAGDASLVAKHLLWVLRSDPLYSVNDYAYALLALVVGLTVLALFCFRVTDREYLWFAVMLLLGAADSALLVAGFDRVPFLIYRFSNEIFVAGDAVAALAFFSLVLQSRRSHLWRTAWMAAALSPLSLFPYYMQWIQPFFSYSLQFLCLLPAYLWIVIELTVRALRRDVSARLLIGPAALLYSDAIFNVIALTTSKLGWQNSFSGYEHALFGVPYTTRLVNIIHVVFVLAMLVFLVRRFSQARREEERLSSELAAARGVQSLLVCDMPTITPGFALQSVYIPATEVGGDFFQLQPAADGSLIIVIGDVSGKGLKAAMTVSVIVGALRGCAAQEGKPLGTAQILSYLNQVLYGQIAGFVTCCAILIHRNGRMTVANAGHIPPYLDGEELCLENGLPLGLAAQVSYTESTFRLLRDQRLTLVTDGVVEARSRTGELFGFERTIAISVRSAQEIAQAAQSFGQDDDITVLTLSLA